jgi:hypothetical protein
MIIISFIIREKEMWLSMFFQGNVNKKGPSFPSISLLQFGSKLFSRNGSKAPNLLA